VARHRGSQNFKMLRELAQVLGGAVGATRPACDEGWAPQHSRWPERKGGQPETVYCRALSGAMSHIAGCLGSKYIVAINKDKEANIFNVPTSVSSATIRRSCLP